MVRTFRRPLVRALVAVLSLAAVAHADTLWFGLVSVNTNQARGAKNSKLARFALALSPTAANASTTLNQLVFRMTPGGILPHVRTLSLHRNDGPAGWTLVAGGIGGSAFVTLAPVAGPILLARGVTNLFELRAEFNALTTGGDVPLPMYSELTNITCAPGVTLSNIAGPTAGTFTVTNQLYHQAIIVSNGPFSGPAEAQCGEEAPLMRLTLTNRHFALTGKTNYISQVTVTWTGGDPADVERLFLRVDDGNPFNPWTAVEIASSDTPSGDEFKLYPPAGILVGGTPVRLWVSARIKPRAAYNSAKVNLNPPDASILVGSTYVSVTGGTGSTGIPIDDNYATTPVSGLSAVGSASATEGRVLLRWTNPPDLDLDTVSISYQINSEPPGYLTGTVWTEPSQSPGLSRELTIGSLMPGARYYFNVYAVDSHANVSVAMKTNVEARISSTKPAAPTGITCRPFADRLEFSWNAVTDPLLQHYIVKIAAESPALPYEFTTTSTSYTVPKMMLPLFMSANVFWIGVVAKTLNDATSENDFTTLDQAKQRGIRVGSGNFSPGTGVVFNNVFRPDYGEKARVLLNLPSRQHALVKVYAVSGELVITLANGILEGGDHEFLWDGSRAGNLVNPGVYFVHIKFGEFNEVKKMVVRR